LRLPNRSSSIKQEKGPFGLFSFYSSVNQSAVEKKFIEIKGKPNKHGWAKVSKVQVEIVKVKVIQLPKIVLEQILL
jgi:hypothetical protein